MDSIMPESSLIPLDGLTKPATVLIKKISEAVGGLCKPFQIVRVAKAEAAADQIRAESQIQITELQRRAMHRFFEEEAKKQSNIEDITQKALPLLKEESSPQDVQDDWITNFFDKSRIVSDSDMQQLWSRVLAGEANTPGSFSRKTVNLLSDLDKRDAELFAALCGFVWQFGSPTPLVFDTEAEVYNRRGINFGSISHLESIGLVQSGVLGFSQINLPKRVAVFYRGTPVVLTFPNDEHNQMGVGKVMLTRAGQELARVCESEKVEGFFEFVCEKWRSESLLPKKDDLGTSPSPV